MSMKFEELFMSVLSMFSLEANPTSHLKATEVNALFKEILEARVMCEKTFNENKEPSTYENKGVTAL